GFGMTAVDLTYRVAFTYGGGVNGKGRYLSNISLVPANLSVIWGFNVNAQAAIPNVTNAGTTDQPVAAAEVQLQWTVKTVMKEDRQSTSYYVRGDGYFKDLSS